MKVKDGERHVRKLIVSLMTINKNDKKIKRKKRVGGMGRSDEGETIADTEKHTVNHH